MDSREAIDIDLSQYWRKLKRHWVPAASIFILTSGLALLATFFLEPSYRATGKLRFKLTQPVLTEPERETGELRPLVSTQNPLSTEIEVISSRPLLQGMINILGLKDSKGAEIGPEEVAAQLEISIVGGTDILELAYESHSPQEATDIVNTLMQLYIRSSIQGRREEAIAARQFIAQQLPQRETVVRQAEETLSQFKEKHNIVDLQSESEAIVTELSKLDSDITTAQSTLDEAGARSEALKRQIGLSTQDAIAVSNLSQSSEIQAVLRDLQAVERQLPEAQKIYQDRHPIVVELKSKRATLNALLQRKSQETLQNQIGAPTVRVELGDPRQSPIKEFLAAEVERRATAKRLASLQKSRSIYDSRTQRLPKLRKELRELERRLQAAQATYETLLNKLQELRVAENTNVSHAQVIEPALIPTKPSTGKHKLIVLGFGTLLGAFLAAASIPVLAMRQRSPTTDIEEIFGYPLWGVISHLEHQNAIDSQNLSALVPVVGKMHQTIQKHPQPLHNNQALTTIVVTSAEPQEGKSTIAANLAAAVSQLGQRVLLIDADLNSPDQHKIFDLPNTLGLSNVITDISIRFDEVAMIINRVMENLDVLTSGIQTINPEQILNSERLSLLLHYFAWNYDFVILDTPPLLETVGISNLGRIADGVLLVTQADVRDPKNITAAREIMSQSEQTIVGVVVDGSGEKGESESESTKAHVSDFIKKYLYSGYTDSWESNNNP